MKRILIAMILVATYVLGDTIESFVEYNFEKNYSFKNGTELKKKKADLSLNFEFYSPQEGKIMGGWGVGQVSGKVEGYSSNEINLMPYYIVSKYYLSGKSGTGFFVKGQGGGYLTKTILGDTDISNISIDNGWYYGVGVGAEYKDFILQVLYREYLGDSTVNGIGTKFEYSTTTLSLGYAIGV